MSLNRTKIDWGIPGLLTWNVITGCKRGCSYCYARKIHERFNKTPFTDIVFHADRLLDPVNHKKPATIFVGSMSDPEYWDRADMCEVLQVCKICPNHTFMFLSKSPYSYHDFIWPKNTILGLTMSCEQSSKDQIEMVLKMIKLEGRKFLSIEPLLGELFVARSGLKYFEKIIVGAMTGQGAVKPKPEWIQSIKDNCPADEIFWKESIRNYL